MTKTKTALIIGASRGLGLALAQEFLKRGWQVVGTVREGQDDHRFVRIMDSPIRGKGAILEIRKRRLWCKPCKKPFTEAVPGIQKGKRHTERFIQSLHWACENFADLKAVRRAYKVSAGFLYENYYKQLERRRSEKLNYPWPKIIGIDEHSFRRNQKTGRTEFATMIVDHETKR